MMSRFDMQAYDVDGNVVGIGSTVRDSDGQPAELLKLTRWQMQGRSGKVLVRWINSGQSGEYYDKVFGLTVKMVPENLNPSFTMKEMTNELQFLVNAFHASVRTRANHPSMVSRANLKRDMLAIRAIYAFLVRLNGYRELPDSMQKEVIQCEMIIEAMYTKK